ncbi:MAG TPA: serine protease [Blastocatellia bacterium]|jgi:V8-like Glu-specific endopeptidase
MNPKPVALPRPPRAEAAALAVLAAAGSSQQKLQDLLHHREALSYQLAQADAEIEYLAFDLCGSTDDTQDVETYDGTLGVSRDFVAQHEPPVGQLQWSENLFNLFDGSNDSPGNVAGVRWGSGGLIANDLFITAGHCFDREPAGWQCPRRNGAIIPEAEIATLMQVNFNYQLNGATGEIRPGSPFPVAQLLEYRRANVDYAIIRLGRNASGELPGEVFGTLRLAAQDLTQVGIMLCLLQHPSGRPKQIEAGPMKQNAAGRIFYDSLDTEGGSSGSPILSPSGEIVGIHTNGGCSEFSGANYGATIGAVRSASSIVS